MTATSAMKTSDVRSRIDDNLKVEAMTVLQGCGLTVSAAIRLFLEKVVQEQGVPFEIKRRKPSTKMVAALKEAKLIERHYDSLDEMMLELAKSESKFKR